MDEARGVLTIGRAARQAGLSPKALRLYEAQGLLPPPARTEAGYRLFTSEDVAVLRFIRQARSLGLRLDEIREILALQRQGAQPCEKVIGLLDARIDRIDRTIADLTSLRRMLVDARNSASAESDSGGEAVVCCIIETHAPPSDEGRAGLEEPVGPTER